MSTIGNGVHTKAIILALVLPPYFRAHKGIARNDWDTIPQGEECQEVMKYLMRTYINTQHSVNFRKEVDKNI